MAKFVHIVWDLNTLSCFEISFLSSSCLGREFGSAAALTEGVFPIAFAHAHLLPLPVWAQVLGFYKNAPFGRTGEVADTLHSTVVLSQR